jgi:hypothetical protein
VTFQRRRSLSGQSPLGWGDQTNQGSDYTEEEKAFLKAIDTYKRKHRRPFPHWREVLAVVKALGYRLPQEGKDSE